MKEEERVDCICALNSANPIRKIKYLLERIQNTTNPIEILCFQNELLTTIGKNCSCRKGRKNLIQNDKVIDLDSQQLHQLEKMIIGNDEPIDLELFDEVENSSSTATSTSFRTAKQLTKTTEHEGGKKKMSVHEQDKEQTDQLANIYNNQQNNSEPVECLKGIEPRMIDAIVNEMITNLQQVNWEQIAGLQHAKRVIQEVVVWPMLRPYLLFWFNL